MAVSTITYTNKVALNENASVADINKVKAEDMNEIKSVVNNNASETSTNTNNIAINTQDLVNLKTYSTAEKVIGTYIGANNVEHTLYEKTFTGSANTNTNIATSWTYPIINVSVVVSKDGTGDYVVGYASSSANCGIYGSFATGNMKIYHGLGGSANYRVTVQYIKD